METWTRREFEPMEIMFAPFSSQLKDTHLMAAAHAPVNLPKHGRGAHPSNGNLALDGRMRNVIAGKGVLDTEEHAGSLFWCVTRTSDMTRVNLDLDQVTWDMQIKMSVPAPKRRKVDPNEWTSSELPVIPILVNKKKIGKHTRLCMFMMDKKKDNKKE